MNNKKELSDKLTAIAEKFHAQIKKLRKKILVVDTLSYCATTIIGSAGIILTTIIHLDPVWIITLTTAATTIIMKTSRKFLSCWHRLLNSAIKHHKKR